MCSEDLKFLCARMVKRKQFDNGDLQRLIATVTDI